MWRSNQLSYRTLSSRSEGVPLPSLIHSLYQTDKRVVKKHGILHEPLRNCQLSIVNCELSTEIASCSRKEVLLDLLGLSRAASRTPSGVSRKEVFQPHLPVRLPCYDLAPITCFTLGRPLRSRTSGAPGFHGLTGGVYKARERIHRAMADARLLANPASWGRVADPNPN